MNTIKAAESCFHDIYFRFSTLMGSFPSPIQDHSSPYWFLLQFWSKNGRNFKVFSKVESVPRCTWTHHKLTFSAFCLLIFRVDVFDMIQWDFYTLQYKWSVLRHVELRQRTPRLFREIYLISSLFSFDFRHNAPPTEEEVEAEWSVR